MTFSWNSSVFSTIQANEYTLVVGTPDFLNNGTIVCMPDSDNDDEPLALDATCSYVDFIRDGYSAGNYTEMSPTECITAYASTFLAGRRNLIAVMDTTSTDANYYLWPPFSFPTQENVTLGWPQQTSVMPADLKNSTAINGTTLVSIFNPTLIGQYRSAFYSFPNPPYQWLCNYYTINGTCTAKSAQAFGESWRITPAMYPIKTCYSELVPPLCKLEYASLLVGIVLVCNAIKTICMVITALKLWRLDNPILVTVGDAASSFLEHPDETTKGYCLIDRNSVKAWKSKKIGVKAYKLPKTLRFFRAASLLRWMSTLLFCLAFIIAAAFLCSQAVIGMESDGFTEKEVWDAGFGSLNPNALLDFFGYSTRGGSNLVILATVLIANLPQLVLSVSSLTSFYNRPHTDSFYRSRTSCIMQSSRHK